MQCHSLRILYISRSHTYNISRVAQERNDNSQYICKRRYNDLSVRKYTKDEVERGRESDGTKEKEKRTGKKRARAQNRAGDEERESEKTLKLNIKLHFAIGSSREGKRKDPTRRNSVVVTKKGSFKEFYFSGIKLFAVRALP